MADLTAETLAQWLGQHRAARDSRGDCMICLAQTCHVEALADALVDEQARAEKAEAEASRKGEANAALVRERNTWARQLADARGEADDARKERSAANDRAGYLDSERTAAEVHAEDAEAALSRVLADVEAKAKQWVDVVATCASVGDGVPCSSCTSRRQVADEFLALVTKHREGQ